MKFEDKLAFLRKQKMFSQEQMAEQFNVTRQTISKWELGQSKPDMDKLGEISKYFNIDVNTLMDEEKDIIFKTDNIEKKNEEKSGRRKLYILLTILLIVIIVLVITLCFSGKKQENSVNSNSIFSIFNNVLDKVAEETKKVTSKNDIETEIYNERVKSEKEFAKVKHNNTFIYSTGTKPTIFVENTLDDVIRINKTTPEHTITVVYNKIFTMDEDKIKDIKHSLKQYGKYEISANYDAEGYINEIILEDL